MKNRLLDATLLGVALVWGSSFVAAKAATAWASPMIVLGVRYGVAALLLAGWVALRRGRPSKRELAIGSVLGVTQALILALETWGVSGTSASNAGLLISMAILLTPAFETSLFGRRLPPAFFAAAGVSVLGVALLLGGPSGGFVLGDGLVLVAAVVRGFHVALVGRLGRGCRPIELTLVQLGVGTLICLPWVIAAPPVNVPGTFWFAVIYLAAGCSVFAFIAQSWAVLRSSASRASLLLGTEPLWAVACGLLLGSEHIGWLGLVGAAFIVAGTYWGQAVEARSHGGTLAKSAVLQEQLSA
ncbi:MAG: DMT family transporter [Propionibacteriaceae bacterium]